MSSKGRPEQMVNDGLAADARPACGALVPMAEAAPWPRPAARLASPPNSMFVTHLIATAARAPQTRSLRRATATDAQSAYRATQRPLQSAGLRTRQII